MFQWWLWDRTRSASKAAIWPLRLVALGYTEAYWYRGGSEAWEAAGLPTTELVVQSW